MQNRAIETFYMFFQGILMFQVLVFGTLYFFTRRKDLLYYSFFLFLATIYFFINAPFTFFGIPENKVWGTVWYEGINIPVIIAENLFYLLFLKSFFADISSDKTVSSVFRITLWFIPFLLFLFLLFTFLKIGQQPIYYTVKLISVIPAIAVAYVIISKKLPFSMLVARGLLCTITGTCVTVCMIALGNNGVHSLFTDGYPLFFIRIGILGDMIFYLAAILKKWHFHEKQLAEEKIQNQQEIVNERLRISRDLHDDIGSTLGSISIYSEVAKNRSEKNENAEEVLLKIRSVSRELIDKMNDIVWSINPGNENFEHLQDRMRGFAAMMLTPRNIVYNFIAGEGINKNKITAGELKNIFIIYKEAIHNIVKYAACKIVNVTLENNQNNFEMLISDDGKGFDSDNVFSYNGNGLKNMSIRAKDINAQLSVYSKINAGTTIKVILKHKD